MQVCLQSVACLATWVFQPAFSISLGNPCGVGNAVEPASLLWAGCLAWQPALHYSPVLLLLCPARAAAWSHLIGSCCAWEIAGPCAGLSSMLGAQWVSWNLSLKSLAPVSCQCLWLWLPNTLRCVAGHHSTSLLAGIFLCIWKQWVEGDYWSCKKAVLLSWAALLVLWQTTQLHWFPLSLSLLSHYSHSFLLSHLLLQLPFLVPFWPAFVLAAHREGEQGKSQSRGLLQQELQSCCVKCKRMMWETWGILMGVICSLYMRVFVSWQYAGGKLTQLAWVTLVRMCPPRKMHVYVRVSTCASNCQVSHWGKDLHIWLSLHTPLGLCFMHLQLSTQSAPDTFPNARYLACPMAWHGNALRREQR